VRKVQQILLDANGYIMPYLDLDQNSRYFKAVQKIGATGLLKGVGVPSGWANATYFYPNKNIASADLLKTWKLKYKYQQAQFSDTLTIQDALYLAAELSGMSIDQIEAGFEIKWSQLGLGLYNKNRYITRIEMAAILNEYDVFNKFDVDIYGGFL